MWNERKIACPGERRDHILCLLTIPRTPPPPPAGNGVSQVFAKRCAYAACSGADDTASSASLSASWGRVPLLHGAILMRTWPSSTGNQATWTCNTPIWSLLMMMTTCVFMAFWNESIPTINDYQLYYIYLAYTSAFPDKRGSKRRETIADCSCSILTKAHSKCAVSRSFPPEVIVDLFYLKL